MSPSTVMALSVAPTASPSVARSARAGAAASVTTKTRSVAMSGAMRGPGAAGRALALRAGTGPGGARPAAARRRASRTGAAGARLVVNTPAMLAGRSAAISATSRPRCLRPARTPEKRNPGTRTRWARRWSFIRGASRLAVALLVLLAAPARARIVAPDLRSIAAHRLDLLRVLWPV